MKATPAADRAALWMTEEEMDAVMSLLLSAPPTARIPDKLAERLLDRVAAVHRTLDRTAARDAGRGRSNYCTERNGYGYGFDRILDFAG